MSGNFNAEDMLTVSSDARILVVDDNAQNLELLQAYLEDLGCQIDIARDGAEAIEIARQRVPDVMVLDVMMPRMSGFQVCEKLKKDPATSAVPRPVSTRTRPASVSTTRQ